MALKLSITEIEKLLSDIMFFDSDDEFTDFCLAPYGVLVNDKDGNPTTWTGVYSDEYKDCVVKGMKFVIKDINSSVCKRQCVSKRVPIQGTGEVRLVQKTVKNVERYDMRYRKYEHFDLA
jgi:hypothetical protein